MTVSRKAAVSLLLSVFLFAVFVVLGVTGFFDLVEIRFYNPAITNALNREINLDTETIQNFLIELQNRFSSTLEEPPVQRSFLTNQSDGDILERSRVYGMLLESLGGLQSVRFIDSRGSRIHFSTLDSDLLRQDRLAFSYRNYDETAGYIPYKDVEVPEYGEPRLILDSRGERIIFSFPFTDAFDSYRGTALFSLSVRAVTERLVTEGRIKIGEDVSIISPPPGIISGLPHSSRDIMIPMVSSVWGDGILSLTTFNSANTPTAMALISSKTDQGIYVGRLVAASVFSFPPAMKFILLASIYLTIYLAIFLCLNIRQDPMTVVQNRFKRLQVTLIEEYYDHKGDTDWNHWRRELEQRREDVRFELKRGITKQTKRETLTDIDSFIDKSWDELLAVIGGRQERLTANIDEEKLQNILNRVLSGAAIALPPAQAAPAEPKPKTGTPASEEAEELESLEEAEPVAAGTEEAEELESLEEAEPLAGDAEEAEELESLEEAEPLAAGAEEAEELESLEEAGDVAAGAEEPEELESLEDAGDANQSPKKSNLRLVFGDDDIPTIVETSGLELVDEDVDSVLNTMRSDEEVGELEDLEGEDLEDEPGKDESPAPARAPRDVLADLASEIEFSAPKEPETGEEIDNRQVEIVSPFATMLSDFNPIQDGDSPAETSRKKKPRKILSKLEELDAGYPMALVYKPFSGQETVNAELNGTPETGEPEKNVEPGPPDTVIEERDGIHYVNENILNPSKETEKKLDPDFKNLINSVLKK